MDWLLLKDWIGDVTGLSEDALHIYAALLIQVAVAICMRRTLAHLLPWFFVLAAILLNEIADLYLPGHPIEQWQIEGGIQDLWNTMLLPSLLLVLARYRPRLMAPVPAPPEEVCSG